jgi:hypothetical protein
LTRVNVMIRAAIVAVTMLLVPSGQVFAESRMTVGNGLKSCGTWTQKRQTNDDSVFVSWVVGYLSGMNLDSTHPDALLGTDFDGLMGWIDNYCRANPLQSIAIAGTVLMRQLQSRAAKR